MMGKDRLAEEIEWTQEYARGAGRILSVMTRWNWSRFRREYYSVLTGTERFHKK